MIEFQPFTTSIFIREGLPVADLCISEIFKLQKESSGNQISNVGGWQSPPYVYNDNMFLDGAVDLVLDSANHAAAAYGFSHGVALESYWININGKHDYNRLHNHLGVCLSAVLFIKAPNGCGDLVFERPGITPIVPDFSTLNALNWTNYAITPLEGRLVVFPATLNHFVDRNESDELRISMAFNFIANKNET